VATIRCSSPEGPTARPSSASAGPEGFALAHPVVAQAVLGARTVEQQAQNLAWLHTDIPAALWSDCRAAGLIDEHAPTPASGT